MKRLVMETMNLRQAVSKINRRGVLLVFPIHNRKLPQSLWAEFFPRTKMRWEWDDQGDSKVADMWHLMKRLSDCRQVIYSKWYQGRATFFSREVFTAMLAILSRQPGRRSGLTRNANEILEILEGDSPLSTKELKALTDLQGKLNEPHYNRALKQLFTRLLIVAYGEVNDGAFPSLALGATRLLYEDLWSEAQTWDLEKAESILNQHLPEGSPFRMFWSRTQRQLEEARKEADSLAKPQWEFIR